MDEEKVWIYQLRCSDGKWFTNVVKDIEKGLVRHYTGLVGSTRGHLPVRLMYLQPWPAGEKAGREYIVRRLRYKPGVYSSKVPVGLPVGDLADVERRAYALAAEIGTTWA